MLYVCPWTVIPFRLRTSCAPPLNFPAFFTSVTVPCTSEPLGMTSFPSSVTGVITDPVKTAPTCSFFVLKGSLVRMVITVSTGTTTGGGGGGGGGGAGAGAGVGARRPPGVAPEAVADPSVIV